MFVLIVEDDKAQRDLLVRAFERGGHQVEARPAAFGLCNRLAGRTDEAIPDVVILDHGLPGLSGGNALEVLARDPRARTIPVVLYSAVPLAILEPLAAVHPCCHVRTKDGHLLRLVDDVVGMMARHRAGDCGPAQAAL